MRNHLTWAMTATALIAFSLASPVQAQNRTARPGAQPGARPLPRTGGQPAYQPRAAQPTAKPVSTAGAAPTGAPIALVDIGFIFKNHPEFTANIDRMKGQVKTFENELRQRHQNLQKRQSMLSQYNVGTSEYKKLEEEVATEQAQLQATTALKRKEILEQEAKIYFSFYQKVRQAVAGYSYNNRIAVVLRFNREEINGDDRGAVLQGVNRPVVNYQKNLDITDNIMQVLGVPQTAARPRTGTPTARQRK